MSSTSILGIGQSALAAAQAGLATTGHNIANVNTPGYSRQVMIQGSAGGQDVGAGFVGKGTDVVTVRRVFSEFLNNQVLSAQISKNSLDSYYGQIQQIDNMLADPTAGVSSAMQDFFGGVQDVASNPASSAARQTMLSDAQALAARFQTVGGRLDEMYQGVNSQIVSSVGLINSYAQQIASLNDAIEKAQGISGESKPANDLLDQRDYLVSEMSKEINVTVVKQGNSYSVYVGNGQAVTVGTETFKLQPMPAPNDSSKIQVGYKTNGGVALIADSSLPGGRLGGLLEFRSKSLQTAQNELGRIAIGLAATFNAQHQLGQDQTGAMGGTFFTTASPEVSASSANTGSATVGASITDASVLTASDYRVQRINGIGGGGPPSVDFVVTRLSDGVQTKFASFPTTVDGITFSNPNGTLNNNDDYLVKPTAGAAETFKVAITDPAKIAAAAPVRTEVGTGNTGSGKIGPVTITSNSFLSSTVAVSYNSGTGQIASISPATGSIAITKPPVAPATTPTTTTYPAGSTNMSYVAGDSITIGGIPVTIPTGATASYNLNPPAPTTLTYSGGSLTGFPAYQNINIVHADGTKQTIAGASPAPSVTFKDGDTISFGGVSFSVSGTPANGDTFKITANTGGVGDNRNALQLASLQTKNTLAGGTMSYSSAYGLMVTQVGNKARELEVNSKAQGKMLEEAVAQQQSESGVNLDEEAANIMRYQQAYQAAAKVMETASKLFETLLNLGGL